MSTEFISRIVGMILVAVGGVFLGIHISNITGSSPYQYASIFLLVGALIGLVLTPYVTIRPFLALRKRIHQSPAQQLLSAVLGLVVGLIIAGLVSFPLSMLPEPYSQFLPFVAAVLFGYLGIMVMLTRQHDISTLIRGQLPTRSESQEDSQGKGYRPVLLDTSGSMDCGDGDAHKLRYGLRLTGALAQIALSTGDRVTVQMVRGTDTGKSMPEESRGGRFGPVRGTGHAVRLFPWLSEQPAGGTTDLNAALQSYARRRFRPGLTILISDLWSPAGFRDGIGALQAQGHETGIIQLLAPDELSPVLAGDLRLVDTETGDAEEVTIDRPMLDRYRRRVTDWQTQTAQWCRGRHVHYVPVSTDLPWEQLVLQTLRARGLID